MDFLVLTVVAAGSFLATSLDSLAFLIPALSIRGGRRMTVAAGYLAGLALIVGGSWWLATLGEAHLTFSPGLLGLVPLAMGLTLLGRSMVGVVRRNGGSGGEVKAPPVAGVGFVGAAAVTLSMSGDNLGVFIPLFADTTAAGDLVVSGALLACGALWSGFAWTLTRRPGVRVVAERWGSWMMPLVMIGVGLYILADTARDLQ